MRRAIFLRELRVGFFQELAAGGIVLGSFAVFRRLASSAVPMMSGPASDAREDLSALLAGLILLMGFSSGARAFRSETRRRQEFFLYVLPTSRQSLWLCLVGGRLAAALPIVALAFFASPFLSGEWVQSGENWGSWAALVLILYPFMFAAGCCFSLILRWDPAVYVAGFSVTLFILAQLFVIVRVEFKPSGFQIFLWFCSGCLIFLALVLLSLHFFRRGEVYLRKRQLANQLFLVVTLVAVLLLIGTVALSPILDKVVGPWTQHPIALATPPFWVASTARLVSPGGRYLAVIEGLRLRPKIARISIIETATGRLLGERTWRGGIEWVTWAEEEEVLWVLSQGESLPLLWRKQASPSADWLRLAPTCQELSRSPAGETMMVKMVSPSLDYWDLLLGRGVVGQSTSIEAEIYQDGSGIALRNGMAGGFLRLIRRNNPEHSPELGIMPTGRWSINPWRDQGALVSVAEGVWHLAGGALRAPLSMDDFLAPYLSFLGELEARTGQPGLLKSVSKGVHSPLFALSLPDRLALYRSPSGADGRVTLYDGFLKREIHLPGCRGGQAVALGLIPARNTLAFLVRYQCRTLSASDLALQHRYFHYLPGSGSPKPLSALDSVLNVQHILLAYLDERTAIWRPEKGETWTILRDGQLRTLWPPQP